MRDSHGSIAAAASAPPFIAPVTPGVHDILTDAERPGSGVLARKLFVGLAIELMGESQ